ncbi:cyclodeaminase/cyclohydrolase family protein [Solicola gregarius]|uniref:Cyclodeaminase/cyclohydrolase family protein n=1 Tax=Solicola gregarius TaxID=2908642 RepID=A0AA46TIY9_9ACTN|nr:cyclodeaminase/cyclohydrolase family protein [Solicola gregarius]UYM06202.1 cyclodeaminase/cyclohydrolase family protein [Solicola gregarius]
MSWQSGDYLQRPLQELLDDVGGADPVPAAGSMAAATGALAAALTAKVARRSIARMDGAEELALRADHLRNRLEPLVTLDAASYAAVLDARRDDKDTTPTWKDAASWPETIAYVAADIADLAAELTENGNPNLRFDAAGAASFAAATAEVACSLVAANEGELESVRAAALRARRTAERAEAATDRG